MPLAVLSVVGPEKRKAAPDVRSGPTGPFATGCIRARSEWVAWRQPKFSYWRGQPIWGLSPRAQETESTVERRNVSVATLPFGVTYAWLAGTDIWSYRAGKQLGGDLGVISHGREMAASVFGRVGSVYV